MYLLSNIQVLRQGSFVKKMYDLLWTQPGFFDRHEDEVALQHSIARYHGYATRLPPVNVQLIILTDSLTLCRRLLDHFSSLRST